MRGGLWLVALVVLVGAAVCVRLGFWQLSRLREKRAANAALAAALAAPPRRFAWDAPPESLAGRRVEARGRFDERTQILLGPRTHDGSPGVEVVTPLVVADGRAVLVDRGWLYSGDATWARPQDYPDTGDRAVRGIAEPIAPAGGVAPPRERRGDGTRLLAARRLDRQALASLVPYAIAPVVLRELPGPGVPARPARTAPKPANESMHLSYAIQWFVFAAILLGGPLVVAATRRR